jgi:hypothetical protein
MDMCLEKVIKNRRKQLTVDNLTASPALPLNRYLEALPRLLCLGKLEAEPPDLPCQAEPGNE